MVIRQLFFYTLLFFPMNEVSVAFNISSTHAKTNLPKRRFSHEQFLISKHLSILHVLLHSQLDVLGLHI